MRLRPLFTVAFALLLSLGVAAQDWKALTQYHKAQTKKQLTDRLVAYASVNTQADAASHNVPSSAGQLQLAKQLAKELKKNGALKVQVDKNGFVTAEIASNSGKNAPVLGLIAHLDTTPESAARQIKPQVVESYTGGNLGQNQPLTVANSPQLLRAKGHTLVTAAQDTGLDAGGKAGVAIIMTLVQFLYDHPALEHGTLKIAFIPDAHSGAGARLFNVPAFGADYAYTVSGGDLGQLTNETFSTVSFTAVFEGQRTVPAGQAMNSAFADNLLMASDFHTLLPRHQRPESTAERRGFIWVDNIRTQQNRSEVTGTVQAFTDEELQQLRGEVTRAFNTVKTMNYKGTGFHLTFTEQDTNMKSALPAPSVDLAVLAMKQEEITPVLTAQRNKTAGAQLSHKGLPTPDIFSGVYNPGTRLEYADADTMEASLRTLIRLVGLYSTQENPKK